MPENDQIQQNDVETTQVNLQQTTENQVQETKKRSSWFTKILGVVLLLLWIGLIWLWIFDVFQILNTLSRYSDYSIWDIIISGWTWAFFLVWVIFTIIWIRNLLLGPKVRTSWFTKIITIIFWLLWLGLIWFSIYWILKHHSDWGKYGYSIRDIIMASWLFLFGPLWILFILIWILSYRTPDVDIYYHPSRLTKILSGIYRFLWIFLIRAGLSNFSLIGTEDLSFSNILYVWWVITLSWILYILLWRLLYNTKIRMHLWFSLLSALVVNVIFSRILKKFSDNWHWIDGSSLVIFWVIITLFTIVYFSISTIIWIIKCRKFSKKWIINPKYLDQTPSKKKIWIITTIVLISIVIIDLIYGKIQWSKIPEIDPSIYNRTWHHTKLPDEEDALVQLRALFDSYGGKASLVDVLDSYYLNGRIEDNKDISWKYNTGECIVISSWWNEYCGTWAWNTDTLKRALNNYYYIGDSDYYKDYLDDDWYLSIDWKKATIFEFIKNHENEIKENLQELDRIVSLDYYLPDDDILNIVPVGLQWYSRSSMIVLQYYMYQKDWDMVMFIIELNYKIVDIFNDSWSFINQLIWIVIQWVVDSGINSYIQIFPKDFRENLSERYSTQTHDKNEIIEKMIRWEYIVRIWAKNGNIMGEVWKDKPFLFQFLFHFPFYSEKDINKLMDYSYYHIWEFEEDFYDSDVYNAVFNNYWSVYNLYWKHPYNSLAPRMISTYDRIDRSIYHKEALIKNLKSGKYDVWFSKPDYEYDGRWLDDILIPTYKEINKKAIKEYSDIIDPCFWKDTLTSNNSSFIADTEFWDVCSQVLFEIQEQDDDEFWLRDALIELTQLWIDYNEFLVGQNDCRYTYWEEADICKIMYNGQDEIADLMEPSYFKLLGILENIESEVKWINIDDYFFIPEMIYDKKNGITNGEINDINNSDLDNTKINDNELSESLNIIKKYSDIINPCFWEDIIDPIPNVGIHHDKFEEICLNTLKELKEQEKDEFWLKDILIEITKSLINYSKFETKVDACWLEEWELPDLCDEIFVKQKEFVNEVKDNYINLSNILNDIEDENLWVDMDKYFYIPYEKIYDNHNLTIIGFFIDQEKAEKILDEIKLQKSSNNN